METAPLRVVIAEDSALIREGIARLIQESGGTVVAKVGDGPSFVEAAVTHRPGFGPSGSDDLTAHRPIRSPKPADTLRRPRFVLDRVRPRARSSSIPG